MSEDNIWTLDPAFTEGMRVESRDGSFRGRIVEIDERAEKWPYTVKDATGREELFSASHLRKVDLVIREISVTDALIHIGAMITTKQAELTTLMLARDVLEQESDS